MIDRRGFLGIGSAAAGSLLMGAKITGAAASDAKPVPGATVRTAYGKVRGAVQDQVECIQGLR